MAVAGCWLTGSAWTHTLAGMAAERRAHEQLDCLQAVWPPDGAVVSISHAAVLGEALWTAGQEGHVVR